MYVIYSYRYFDTLSLKMFSNLKFDKREICTYSYLRLNFIKGIRIIYDVWLIIWTLKSFISSSIMKLIANFSFSKLLF